MRQKKNLHTQRTLQQELALLFSVLAHEIEKLEQLYFGLTGPNPEVIQIISTTNINKVHSVV